jgi:hypothetical protein
LEGAVMENKFIGSLYQAEKADKNIPTTGCGLCATDHGSSNKQKKCCKNERDQVKVRCVVG